MCSILREGFHFPGYIIDTIHKQVDPKCRVHWLIPNRYEIELETTITWPAGDRLLNCSRVAQTTCKTFLKDLFSLSKSILYLNLRIWFSALLRIERKAISGFFYLCISTIYISAEFISQRPQGFQNYWSSKNNTITILDVTDFLPCYSINIDRCLLIRSLGFTPSATDNRLYRWPWR